MTRKSVKDKTSMREHGIASRVACGWDGLVAAGIVLVLASVTCALLPFMVSGDPISGTPLFQEDEAPAPAQPEATPDKSMTSALNLHQWGSITLFHGLPSDHVRAIAQDRDGTMYLGTDEGLARYDGRRIQKVSAVGLPGGRIRSLSLDPGGSLWVGTDYGSGRLSASGFQLIEETKGQPITAIAMLEKGKWALGSDQGTVFICSVSSGGVHTTVTGPRESPLLSTDANRAVPIEITSLSAAEGSLLIGTNSRGLLRMEGGVVKEENIRPRPFFVKSFALDSGGRMWLGADAAVQDSGLYLGAGVSKLQKIGAATGAINAISLGQSDEAWIGAEKHGVYHFKGDKEIEHFTFENTAGGLRSNFVDCIFRDREGVLWFGTDRGVCRYDPGSPHAERISTDPQSNFVRTIFRSTDGSLWCGTNRGLFSKQATSEEWLPQDGAPAKPIFSIVEDRPGHLVAGSALGLYQGTKQSGEGGKWQFQPIENNTDPQKGPQSIRAVAMFRGAVYAASFGRGLLRLDGTDVTQVWPGNTDDKDTKDVVSLYPEGDARLWIGTAESGVFAYDGGRASRYPGLESLAGSPVWSIAGTLADELWLATGRGLKEFRSGTLTGVIDGVDARGVAAASGKGLLWCATDGGGLYEISPADLDSTKRMSRLDVERGLPSDSLFAVLPDSMDQQLESGREGLASLWIGTSRGIARYSPSTTPPVLKAARILGKRAYQPEELPAGLILGFPQSSLLLEVAAISSRTFPEQYFYSFVLTDAAGKVIGQKSSQDSQYVMEGLAPGAYRVQARAYSNDLIPSEPLSFRFTVSRAPFPWTSAALGVLLLFALAALGWGSYQNLRLARANTNLAGANLQLAETRQQLANETENERRRIARDLHDQTLADLRRLLLMTDELGPTGSLRGPGNGRTAGLRTEIETISTEIRRICEDLSPSVLVNVGLMAALEWALSDAVAHLPSQRKFEYEYSVADDLEERLNLPSGGRI
ncbi:MAG TPA: two-component regulator propeller domain-containing protein, partial [Blastocatellia bacterium]|nr:two-component regulator propeller domain-containing protein [Blastocatellia bacterium]